jgi:WD40 repeat protein
MTNLQADRSNPYIGPRPFPQGEPLYGRDSEIERLLNLIIAERIVLLHSPSGAGKTSLIQAALIPALRDEGFRVLPIIRVGAEIPLPLLQPGLVPTPDSLLLSLLGLESSLERASRSNRYILSAMLSLEEGYDSSGQFSIEELAQQNLSDYIRQRVDAENKAAGIVLIFDQFEEILTIEPGNHESKAAFFAEVGEMLRDRNIWAVFAIREDYRSALDPYLRQIPTRFSTTFRLNLLQADASRLAIQLPVHRAGVDYTNDAVTSLVDDLRLVRVQRPDGFIEVQRGSYIEPMQLQVVCYRLWERRFAGDEPINGAAITAQDVASVGDVNLALSEYYNERVQKIASITNILERKIRDWFDQRLITEELLRGQVQQGSVSSGDLDNTAIALLIEAHLVRAEKRAGTTWFELTHDRLIEPIRMQNRIWREDNLSMLQRQAAIWHQQHRPDGLLLSRAALNEAVAWATAHAQEINPVEQAFLLACRKAQNVNRLIHALTVLTLAMACIAFLLFIRANSALIDANNARAAAENARATSEAASIVANRQLMLSNAQEALRAGELDQAQLLAILVLRGDPTLKKAELILSDAAFQPSARTQLAGHMKPVQSVAFSPDGKIIVSGSADQTMRLWDVTKGQLIRTFEGHTNTVQSVAFSPDGKTIVSGSADQTVRLWDVTTGQIERTFLGSTEAVRSVVFSPDGKTILFGGADWTVQLWDIATGHIIHTFEGHTEIVRSVAFSPDGKTIISSAADRTIRLWDVATGELVRTLFGHQNTVQSVAFAPDGRSIASGADDNMLRLWDTTTGQTIRVFVGHTDIIQSAMFSPDGKTIISSSEDGTMRLWDITTGQTIRTFAGLESGSKSVVFSPDGKTIVSGSNDNILRLWDVTTGQIIHTFEGHTGNIQSVAFSPDGKTIISGASDRTIRLWDVATSNLIRTFEGHTGTVQSVAFSRGGKVIASGSSDGSLRLWDVTTGQIIRTFEGHTRDVWSIAFSPDEKSIVSGSADYTVRLWNVTTGQLIRTFTGYSQAILSVVFSPDGRSIVSGSNDKTLRQWDVATGQLIRTFIGHTGAVQCVAFSPDGKTIVSCSADNTLRLWSIYTMNELINWVVANRYVPNLIR